MAKIAGPFVMPDEYAVLIGRISESFSQLEFSIDLGIWALSEAPQQLVACVTAQLMGTHTRMNAFMALAELRGAKKETIDQVKTFKTKRIDPLSERRNRAVHDPRWLDENTETMHRLEITAKPSPHFEFVPESPDDLAKVHTLIHTTVTDFGALRDSVIAEIEALPAESRPPLRLIRRILPSQSDPETSPQAH